MPIRLAKALCDFIDASPSAFHAVDSAQAALAAAGAARLDERDAWRLEPGKAYFVVRDGAALVAFRTGLSAPWEAGISICGAHVDAPGFRARLEKPVAARGVERVAVEPYGGPIHSTWLDRPLSLAGRVVARSISGGIEARLVNFARPVAVIPNLAIHFNKEMNKGVEYAANSSLLPLVGSSGSAEAKPEGPWLARALAAELGLAVDSILSADLSFVDAVPSCLFGLDGELISAPRIDDLAGCHAALIAFLQAKPTAHAQALALFDNEEVGSGSPRGADSSFLRDGLERLVESAAGGEAGHRPAEAVRRTLARSFCVSVDGAQGWHPSYADRFDEDYAPLLNGGPAVKSNANVRYATEAVGEAAFRQLCAKAGVPVQRFRMRADLPAGTTIGPISAAHLGVRTVDVGVPMLAMHSARETAGARDHAAMIGALSAFYGDGPSIADAASL